MSLFGDLFRRAQLGTSGTLVNRPASTGWRIGGLNLGIPDPRTVAPSDSGELTNARKTAKEPQIVPPTLYDDSAGDLVLKKPRTDPNSILPPGQYEVTFDVEGEIKDEITRNMLAQSLKASVPGYISHRFAKDGALVVVIGG